MLKLTQGEKRRPIWIAIAHIVAVSDDKYGGATITPSTGFTFHINETPAEVIQLLRAVQS
jgi:hypothetical protein